MVLIAPIFFLNQQHSVLGWHIQYAEIHYIRYITSVPTLHNFVCIIPLLFGNRLRY